MISSSCTFNSNCPCLFFRFFPSPYFSLPPSPFFTLPLLLLSLPLLHPPSSPSTHLLLLLLCSHPLTLSPPFFSFLFSVHPAIPYKALLRECDNRKKHLRVSWVHTINAAHSGQQNTENK